MTVHHAEVVLGTGAAERTIDITERVQEAVRASGIREGLCTVATAHTTTGVFVNENADPAVQADLLAALHRIVADDARYRHAEGNSPAHLRAVLVGNDVSLPVRDGALALGTWQGIFFAEFDGPRQRRLSIVVIGDRDPTPETRPRSSAPAR